MNTNDYNHAQDINELKISILQLRKDLEHYTQIIEERLDSLDDYLEEREEITNRILANLEYMRND